MTKTFAILTIAIIAVIAGVVVFLDLAPLRTELTWAAGAFIGLSALNAAVFKLLQSLPAGDETTVKERTDG